jgi:hypothetical protein
MELLDKVAAVVVDTQAQLKVMLVAAAVALVLTAEAVVLLVEVSVALDWYQQS